MMPPPNRQHFDLAIIGAGPAGLAAATRAQHHGLSVIVLDEGSQPGGRIYHAVDRVMDSRPADVALLGEDYTHGANLTMAFRQSGVDYADATSVFRLDQDGTVWFTRGGTAGTLRADNIILATGAMERPVPLPGWTLPGVMTAGAAQLLLKGDNMIPSGPVVLMGAGPLILLCAIQLHDAGAAVTAIVETTTMLDTLRALPHLPRALLAQEYLRKGLTLRRRLKKAGIAIYGGATGLRILGTEKATGVSFQSGGKATALNADTVLLHNGVVPETHLSRQLGCRHRWDSVQRCWRPESDAWGQTSVPTVYVAGDGGGIAGARAAECAGHLSALRIATTSGRLNPHDCTRLARAWIRERRHHLTIRPFLDSMFRPSPDLLSPPDDETIVCRCEEVDTRAIRHATEMGCPGPNQLKAFCRAGMGPCQGRMCQLTITEIMAEARNTSPDEIGTITIRPPVKPVTLSALAAMANDSE
ncbi:MAG: FAD-dependent oxidoreductase [Rhodospirillales bacterium]|nr:FAD-dependent oxidoreductase [Rhodospirillales bacterium]